MSQASEECQDVTANQRHLLGFVEGVEAHYFFFATDKLGVVTYVSPSVESILGFTPAEIVGKNWREFAHVTEPLGQSSSESDRDLFECCVSDASGAEKTLEVLAFDVKDNNGALSERYSLARDTTGIWMGEETKSEHVERLEERCKALAYTLALVLREQAPAGVIEAMVHELAQPLTAIVSYGYAILHELRSGKAATRQLKTSTETIINAAHLAAGILKSIRMRMDGQERELELTNLNQLVEDTLTLFAHDFQEHDIAVTFTPSSDNAQVTVDRVQIQEVVVNLVSNAIEAVDASIRRRAITVSVTKEVEFAAVTVSDNGTGVPPGKPDLFSPGSSSKPEGLGIGLGICKRVVEWHGGEIWYADNDPFGASFHFTLPLGKDEG